MRPGITICGKYTLLSQIGRGGMGSVWLARNDLIEREFAIKLLHPAAADDPKIRERFLREARIPGRARHPNIVEVVDVGTAPELDNLAFIVMELLDGVALDVAIRALGGLPIRLSLLVGAAIGRALDAAHACGVLHRDLKPANVFLHRSHNGHLVPKLVDFGVSKMDGPAKDPELELTKAGTVLGSPLYMSPEQAAGDRDLDGRSDVHALGVTLYWSIAGQSPFTSKRFDALLVELTRSARPRLRDVRPDVPDGVSALVAKAFAADRADRFQTAAELVAAIEAELAAMGPGPTLDSRASVEEIFGRLRAAGVPVAEMRPGHSSSPSNGALGPAATVGVGTVGSAASAFAASVRPPTPSGIASRKGNVLPWLAGVGALAFIVAAGALGFEMRPGHVRPTSALAAAAPMHAAPRTAPTTEQPAPEPLALAPAPAETAQDTPDPVAHAVPPAVHAPVYQARPAAVVAQPPAKATPSASTAPALDELPQTRW